MKKKIFLVSTLVAMAMGMMFVSCEKKDAATDKTTEKEEINGCKCTVTWDDGEKDTFKYDLEEMEDYYDVTTCAKLKKALMEDAEGVESLTCKEY